jgi:hypothetical protein
MSLPLEETLSRFRRQTGLVCRIKPAGDARTYRGPPPNRRGNIAPSSSITAATSFTFDTPRKRGRPNTVLRRPQPDDTYTKG